MKRNYLKYYFMVALVGIGYLVCPSTVDATPANTAFKDDAFYSCILNSAGLAEGTNVTDEQLASITDLSCYGENQITDTTGIDKLTNLSSLSISSSKLTSIDVSKNTNLRSLAVWSKNLASINVANNTNLISLNIMSNLITGIDVSKNTELTSLSLTLPKLTSLDVSKNTKLNYLSVFNNSITSLDVSKNTELVYLSVYADKLPSLDVSKNTKLSALFVESDAISNIDVTNNTNLYVLQVGGNLIKFVDTSKNTNLETLILTNMNVTCMDASKYNVQHLYIPKKVKYINLGDSTVTTLYLDTTPAVDDSLNLGLGMGATAGGVSVEGEEYIKEINVSSNLFTDSKNITKEGVTIYRDSSATDFCSDKVVVEDNNNEGSTNNSSGSSVNPGTNSDSNKENVEITVENPPTGVVVSISCLLVAIITGIGYLMTKKKSYFSKI